MIYSSADDYEWLPVDQVWAVLMSEHYQPSPHHTDLGHYARGNLLGPAAQLYKDLESLKRRSGEDMRFPVQGPTQAEWLVLYRTTPRNSSRYLLSCHSVASWSLMGVTLQTSPNIPLSKPIQTGYAIRYQDFVTAFGPSPFPYTGHTIPQEVPNWLLTGDLPD